MTSNTIINDGEYYYMLFFYLHLHHTTHFQKKKGKQRYGAACKIKNGYLRGDHT